MLAIAPMFDSIMERSLIPNWEADTRTSVSSSPHKWEEPTDDEWKVKISKIK